MRAAVLVAVAVATLASATAGATVCLVGSQTYNSFNDGNFQSRNNIRINNSGQLYLPNNVTSGTATSKVISTEIATPSAATLSFVHASWTATNACGTGATVSVAYSVDGGTSFHTLTPTGTTLDASADVLVAGYSGGQLAWQVTISDPQNLHGNKNCALSFNSLEIDHEALPPGEYSLVEPVTTANALVRGTWETSSSTWTLGTPADRSLRGHLRLVTLYDPDTLVDGVTTRWDAGAVLASTSPAVRNVYWNNNGSVAAFNILGGSTLAQAVLPLAVRAATFPSGKYVYDLNGDGLVDDNDGYWIVNWALGVTGFSTRPWDLGADYTSTAGIVGPPGQPWWYLGADTPSTERTAYASYQTNNLTRATRVVVGASDGMIHAFNAGSFRWGDDPSTPQRELRGYFAKVNGVRDYGDGSESWAWVPSTQIAQLKNAAPTVASYQPDANPRPANFGELTVVDGVFGGVGKTIIVYPNGRRFPYIGALDVSNPSAPALQWSSSWGDANFNGTFAGVPVGPVMVGTTRTMAAVATSGWSSTAADLYMYVIDAASGSTVSKVQLDKNLAQSTGFVGSPVLVDSDGSGSIDRAYAVDTSGRLFKYSTTSGATCLMASAGETVYAPIAVEVVSASPLAPVIRLYFGGGDDPTTNDTPNPNGYHFFAYEDDDPNGACTTAKQLYATALNNGEKIWTAPAFTGSSVFYATATGDKLSPCDGTGGTFNGVSTTASGVNNLPVVLFTPLALGGQDVVGGVHLFDGHVQLDTVGGQTIQKGSTTWNNPLPTLTAGTTAASSTTPLPTSSWIEQ